MEKAITDRFAALFTGSPLYYITCNSKRAKDKQNVTQRKQYTIEDIKTHLDGKLGIGTSPLLPDHKCWFAAIDIDRRDDVDEVDFADIAQRVAAASFPLVMARTRSGGAHLYLFLKRPAPAKLVRALITEWAGKLKIDGTDCLLPAADYQLFEDDQQAHISRSINLPYLGGDDTTRYAFAADGVTKLTLAEFVDLAEAKAIDPSLFMAMPDDEYAQAPPCVQRLLREGIPKGLRNEAMTQVAIYLKRVDGKDVLPRLSAINGSALESPLTLDEVKKIAKSATRRDYKYRCKVEPAKSLCNSPVCLTREFGIKPNEHDENENAAILADMPGIDDIARVQETEMGGIYRLRIAGKTFTASIKQLTSVRDAQALFVEHVGIILPATLKFSTWYDFIMVHIRNARIEIEAPEDTEAGGLRVHLDDFIAGRLKTMDQDDIMQHRARLDTAPILEDDDVIFRLATFERYCRDKRISLPSSQVRTVSLLRKIGGTAKRLRTPAGVVGVWALAYKTGEHDQHYDEIAKPDPNNDY